MSEEIDPVELEKVRRAMAPKIEERKRAKQEAEEERQTMLDAMSVQELASFYVCESLTRVYCRVRFESKNSKLSILDELVKELSEEEVLAEMPPTLFRHLILEGAGSEEEFDYSSFAINIDEKQEGEPDESETSDDQNEEDNRELVDWEHLDLDNVNVTGMTYKTGTKGIYLYSDVIMSSQYAQWAYLAAEENDVATLVETVRNESKVYPRPMLASSLAGPPVSMDKDRIEETYIKVKESGDYPDILMTKASNGDVYYYSSDYMSTIKAHALAQWNSVEKLMNI